ncbi:hypothetical protein F383_06819 [Gossypium arboreum]|uniref:Uncharacterized protein n=1 Tax=Gossypium arboreum TaxID=29729 RepID=A0A0B0NTM1_GOSAR|nr:hypothetical protein F383_06819 [Gossypium arboreum]
MIIMISDDLIITSIPIPFLILVPLNFSRILDGYSIVHL